MSTKTQVQWRRAKILELSSKGYSQVEIAKQLMVDEPTISRDVAVLKRQAKENIRNYIDEELPHEYSKTLIGLTAIVKEAWAAADSAASNRDKTQALDLAHRAYETRLDLLASATVVESAVKFVEGKKKARLYNLQQTAGQPETEAVCDGIF